MKLNFFAGGKVVYTTAKDQTKPSTEGKRGKDKPPPPLQDKEEKTKDKSVDDDKREKLKDKAGKNKVESVTADVFKVDNNLMPAGPYYNIKASRAKKFGNLEVIGDGGDGRVERREGTFCLEGDGRVRKTVKRYREEPPMNMTLSFDPSSLICVGCTKRGPHSVAGLDDGKPIVLVACDQSFPPVLFSKDEESCIAVMRIEDGGIKEISYAVADLFAKINLPEGSVILLGSVSALAKMGTIPYAEELVRSIRIIGEKLGGRVSVHPFVPIPICGINNSRVIRSIMERDVWMEKMEGPVGVIHKRTRDSLKHAISKHGEGAKKSNDEQVLVLPAGISSREKISIRSVGWRNMPVRVYPISEESEMDMVLQLVEDLQENCGVELSARVDLDRKCGPVEKAQGYMVVGGSGAGYLGDALEQKGRSVRRVVSSGWRATKMGVSQMEIELKKEDLSGLTIVFLPLDNHSFYAVNEDGLSSFPMKLEDGKWHVGGRVEVASAATTKATMRNCGPIMNLIEKNRKIIVTPAAKFFNVSCCAKEEHSTNVGEAGYRSGLLEALGKVEEVVRGVCVEERTRNYKVANPNSIIELTAQLEEKEVERLVGRDGYHLTKAGYGLLAEGILCLAESKSSVFGGEKRERVEEVEREVFPVVGGRRE